MNVNFLQSVEPSSVTLDGARVPLFFSLRAAALMEQAAGLPYPTLISRLFQTPDEDGGQPEPLGMEAQSLVIACLIHEGQRAQGQAPDEVTALAEMIGRLHMSQANALILAATQEILLKSSRGKPGKNG